MADYRDPTTALLVLIKQPSEDTVYDIPMGGVMRSADTIASFVANQILQQKSGLVTPSIDLTLGAPAADGTGLIAQVRIQDGTDGENYTLTVRVNTTGGDIRERDVMLYVRD